jgi:hypothetical protein
MILKGDIVTEPKMEAVMAEKYECGTCGMVTHEKEHLCDPIEIARKGDYCGRSGETDEAMCEPMSSSLEFTCSSCGRPTEDPDMVCSPEKKS